MSIPIRLSTRKVLRVAGKDTLRFLQGLVTVNVHRLCEGEGRTAEPALFGAFLNRKGRVEHTSFFVPNGDQNPADEILLDCPAASAPALQKHLNRLRLRAKVKVEDVSDSLAVVVRVPDNINNSNTNGNNGRPHYFFNDPRLPQLHQRAIMRVSQAANFDSDNNNSDLESVIARRIILGVPDDDDFGSNAPLPLHMGLHLLNSVDFDKGCYLGQELTARTHFTGVLRKRITPIVVGIEDHVLQEALASKVPYTIFNPTVEQLQPGTQIFCEKDGKLAGSISSAAGNCGLAVMKLQALFGDPPSAAVGAKLVTESGRPALPWKPFWWNDEVNSSTH